MTDILHSMSEDYFQRMSEALNAAHKQITSLKKKLAEVEKERDEAQNIINGTLCEKYRPQFSQLLAERLGSTPSDTHWGDILVVIGAEFRRADKNLAELQDIAKDFLEDTPCQLDHHGHCQAHGFLNSGKCPMPRLKLALKVNLPSDTRCEEVCDAYTCPVRCSKTSGHNGSHDCMHNKLLTGIKDDR